MEKIVEDIADSGPTVDATTVSEFFYRLPGNSGNIRPGAHRSTSRGAGMNFISHAKLIDQPDPRRLDLRASIGNLSKEWLVRVNQQRVAITITVIVDVSAGMHFRGVYRKLDVAADFIEALGYSAAAMGDSIGLYAFDHSQRNDLSVPSRFGRATGLNLANRVRACRASGTHRIDESEARTKALAECVSLAAGNSSLVFILSDYHWSLTGMESVLDPLAGTLVVPIVVWDPVETEPPAGRRLMSVQAMGAGKSRHLWLTPRVRQQWLANVEQRRLELSELFGSRDTKPFMMTSGFNADAMSKYFMELGVQ